jgi:hypothetical protein
MPKPTEQVNAAHIEIIALRDVAELLIRHKDLHEGLYNLAFQFQIAIGAVGPSPDAVVPGAMFGVSGLGLEKVDRMGPYTVDAAIVNPSPDTPVAKKPSAKPIRRRGSAMAR